MTLTETKLKWFCVFAVIQEYITSAIKLELFDFFLLS